MTILKGQEEIVRLVEVHQLSNLVTQCTLHIVYTSYMFIYMLRASCVALIYVLP